MRKKKSVTFLFTINQEGRQWSPVIFMKIKFRNMPLGGRFFGFGKVWIVLQRYGDGLVAEECLNPNKKDPLYTSLRQSLCCFVDEEAGITLDSEVDFIGLEAR